MTVQDRVGLRLERARVVDRSEKMVIQDIYCPLLLNNFNLKMYPIKSLYVFELLGCRFCRVQSPFLLRSGDKVQIDNEQCTRVAVAGFSPPPTYQLPDFPGCLQKPTVFRLVSSFH